MLWLKEAQRAALAGWAVEGYPNETCGLLIGRPVPGGSRVLRAAAARNLSSARLRDRYELDPLDLLRCDQEARREGLDVVGIWHSHPDHPAVPSETDRAAAWEGWSYVIAAVGREGLRDLRSFRLAEQRFVEEELVHE